VVTAYTPDGQVKTLCAWNDDTGNQTTTYVYGTTLSDSDIARSDLLRAEIYPDSDDVADPLGDGEGGYDRVEYKYNCQGQVKEKKDQNETVHQYEFDGFGRQTEDRATALGEDIDGGVRRISRTYNSRGLPEKITSLDAEDTVVNEVEFEYNEAALPVTEYQEHGAAVNSATSPNVQYAFDETVDAAGELTKGLRPTSVTYPNGRILRYEYGPFGKKCPMG